MTPRVIEGRPFTAVRAVGHQSVLKSSQLQIHRPSLILPFFLFPSHPPSLNQASLCFPIGLSFSLGARSLAVGSHGRSSDGLALISRIVPSLEPLCAFSSHSRKTLIGIQHRALIPVSTIYPLGLGDEGYSIYPVPHRASSGGFEPRKSASGNGSSKHHLRVLFTHGHTVTGIKEHSEITQPDAVEHIRSWLLFQCFIRCGESMFLNEVTLFLKGQ